MAQMERFSLRAETEGIKARLFRTMVQLRFKSTAEQQ